MPQYAPTIVLSPRQRGILESIARSSATEHRVVERARIILGSADGRLCVDMAAAFSVNSQRVRRWRRRFAEDMGLLASAEAQDVSDADLETLLLDVISDEPKSGGPPKFTPEQFAQLVALACELPSKFGLPVTHWTPGDLAREANKQGIASISPRHLGRFLKGGGHSSPHLTLLAQSEDRRPGAPRRGGRSGLRSVRERHRTEG
jgi:putative transposase